MIKIIDTSEKIRELFDCEKFNLQKWRSYADSIYPGLAQLLWAEVKEYTASGKYSFEADFLPIIEAVCGSTEFDVLVSSFRALTDRLSERISESFDKELELDIVLYLGLCNGAGYATNINGRDTVLLGVEKILELGWHSLDELRGLLYHELGHIYHMQHDSFEQETEGCEKQFVYQLFCEGIAMYFEQALVGELQYYHQDKNGWKLWCDAHFSQIVLDFDRELPTMEQFDQRFFGDWVDYCGWGDVGYYLGARFIHHLLDTYSFDELIKLDIGTVLAEYKKFVTVCGRMQNV